MNSVIDYLNSKNVPFKHAGPNNIHLSCFFHSEDPSKRGRLYINVDPAMSPPGLFHCHVCGERGALNKIRKHFGDPPLDDDGNEYVKGSSKKISTQNLSILRAAADYYNDRLYDNEEAFDWLRTKRGLTLETIMSHKLGYADGGLGSHLKGLGFAADEIKNCNLIKADGSDFFVNRITIPYIINGHVLQIRGKDMNGKYFTPPGDQVRPYNIDSVRNAKSVVITEGEFDALVVEQLGYATIGVPGSTSWQDDWNGYLSEAKRIYACFDRDDSGDRGFERVEKSIGARVKKVLMPLHAEGETKNDPSEWIVVKGHTAEEFAELIAAANQSLVVDVNEALQEWLQMEGNPIKNRMSIGFPTLDLIIDGGVQNGQVVVLLARTGTGKTISLVNMFHYIIQNDPTKKILFFSLEQTRNEWFDRALKIYSFHNNPKPKSMAELDLWKRYISERDDRNRLKYSIASFNIPDMVNFYQNNLMIVDKNRVTEDEFRLCVDDYIEAMGAKPDIIAVDYLGYWARAFKGEGYERTTAAIMKLKELGKDIQVPIITPHQVNRMANDQRLELTSSRDSGAVEETADFLFALQRTQQQEADPRATGMRNVDTNELTIDVLKSRHGGKGRCVTLIDAPQSLVLLEKQQNAINAKAKDQVGSRMRGESLNDFYLRVASGVPHDHDENWRDKAFRRLEDELRNES